MTDDSLLFGVLESNKLFIGWHDFGAGSEEFWLMPERISSLIFHSLFQSFLKIEYGLIIAVNILDAFPELNEILDNMFGILKFVDGLPIFGSFVVKVLEFDIDVHDIFFCRWYFRVYFIESLLDFGPVWVAFLFMRVNEFGDRLF